jgi:hypothetical protein
VALNIKFFHFHQYQQTEQKPLTLIYSAQTQNTRHMSLEIQVLALDTCPIKMWRMNILTIGLFNIR